MGHGLEFRFDALFFGETNIQAGLPARR